MTVNSENDSKLKSKEEFIEDLEERMSYYHPNLREYSNILNYYKGKPPYAFDWYYHYSTFGAFFVDCYLSIEGYDVNLKEIWDDIVEILKNKLPTYEDVATITRNLDYVTRRKEYKIRETPDFMLFQMHQSINGQTSFKELMEMDYKTFFKLYLFRLGINILSRRELERTKEHYG